MRLLFALLGMLIAAPAAADSCWTHNGSLLRLTADGTARVFAYERPRAGLLGAGVRAGTLLFEGRNLGGWYSGTARTFSSDCPGQPHVFAVEGPVGNGQRRVTLRGVRELHERCEPVGRQREDVLVFDYSHQC